MAVFGLGGSGLATAQALVAGGADVVAFDDNPESVSKAEEAGINTQDLREVPFQRFDALVLAPGVPLTHPQPHWSVDLANAADVPIIGDVELFANERRAIAPTSTFIAITGTNGKSTTTALISHVLKQAGLNVQMGGNIGRAVLTLDQLTNDAFYVVECSSYQIDLAPSLDPKIGVLLNLSPDHLDRHGDMENYAAIKERLVAKSEFAVVGVDDDYSAAIASFLEATGTTVERVSIAGPVNQGVWAKDGILHEARGPVSHEVADLSHAPTLRGKHNAQNAAIAWAVCRHVGLSGEAIQAGLSSFPGLAHRMEIVTTKDGVLFVNDSKATNADATGMALGSFERIYWIAGGLAKEGGIEPLRQFFPRIAKAYLIGEAAPQFAATLGETVPYQISGTLASAVKQAAMDAGEDENDEPVVLLSPACASFDQYRNFEVRGDAFRECVSALNNQN